MYPIKLSQLSAATSVATNDILEIVDRDDPVMGTDGTNKNVTAQLLANSLCKMVTTSSSIIATTSEPALKIKQEGTGHCLLIEDFPLTDASPLVVTGDGKVGIGTASPSDKVHIEGTVHLAGATAQFQLNPTAYPVDSANLTNTYISFGAAGAEGDWAYLRQIGSFNKQIITLDLHDDRPDTNSGAGFMIRQVGSFYSPDEIHPSFYVDPSNKIGIATASPACALDIASAGVRIHANGIISSNSNSQNLTLAGGAGINGANIELYGASHSTAASHAYIDAEEIRLRSQNGSTTYLTATSTAGVNIPTLTTTTATAGTNNTTVATTAFTQSALLGTVETISGNAAATISAAYYNRYTRFTNTTGITVTLPASLNPSVGTKIRIRRAGTGSITLATSGSVPINGNTADTMPQHGTFELIYVSAGVWDYIQY